MWRGGKGKKSSISPRLCPEWSTEPFSEMGKLESRRFRVEFRDQKSSIRAMLRWGEN
jgi:hypothetical protein